MNIKQRLAKAMLLVLLFLVGGMVSEAWAQTYTYKVIDSSGTEVASATSTSSTLEVPDIIKAASCLFRYYDSAEKAQAMSASNEMSELPASNANIIYVGFRSEMRIFPLASRGKYAFLVQRDNQNWLDLNYLSDSDTYKARNNEGSRWQLVGTSPYDVMIKNADGYYIKVKENDDIVRGTNTESEASHFMILNSGNYAGDYTFRVIDGWVTTPTYLYRVSGQVSTDALKKTTTKGTGSEISFAFKSSGGGTAGTPSYSVENPNYRGNIYDSYGNFVTSRWDGNYKEDAYRAFWFWSNTTESRNVFPNRWITGKTFYATDPGDENAVPITKATDNLVYDINMVLQPRWKDASNPGVMVNADGTQELDLSGKTLYFIKFNRSTDPYMYAASSSEAKFTFKTGGSNKTPGVNDKDYQWTLEGRDPMHVILRNAKYGTVVSVSGHSITNTKPDGAGKLSSSVTKGNVVMAPLNESDPTYIQSWALLSKNGTQEYLAIPGASGNDKTIYALDAFKSSTSTEGTMGLVNNDAWTMSNDPIVTFEAAPVTYFFRVVNPITHEVVETIEWGEQTVGTTLELPNSAKLQRKDCILGTTYYLDPECTQLVTAVTAGEPFYYLTYTFNADAFKTHTGIEFSTESSPKWFNIELNSGTPQLVTASASNTVLSATAVSEDNKKLKSTQFAFIGDPYSMKILNRSTGQYATKNDADSKVYSKAFDASRSLWAVLEGTNDSRFVLTQQGLGDGARSIWSWNSGVALANEPATASADYDVSATEAVDAFQVTYIVYNAADNEVARATVWHKNGDSPDIPESISRYKCLYTYHADSREGATMSTLTEECTVYVTYTVDSTSPVKFYTDYESIEKWYNIRFNSQQESAYNWFSFFMRKNLSDTNYKGEIWPYIDPSIGTDKGITGPGDARAYFAFVGDPYAFKVVNMYAGENFVAGQNDSYLKMTETSKTWTWIAPTVSGNAFKIVEPTSFDNTQKTFWYFSGTRVGFNQYTDAEAPNIIAAEAPARYNLTYQVLSEYGTQVLATTTESYATGTILNPLTLPVRLQRAYCTYTFYATSDFSGNPMTSFTVNAEGQTVYVKCTVQSGIFSPDYAHPVWFHMMGGSSSGNYLMTNDSDSTLTANTASISTEVSNVDEFVWTLVGNPYDVRLMSRKLGESYYAQPNTDNNNSSIEVLTTTGDLSHWEAVPSTTGDFALVLKGSYADTQDVISASFFGKDCQLKKAITIYTAASNSHYFVLEPYAERSTVTYLVFNAKGEKVAEASAILRVGATPLLPESVQRYGIREYMYHRDKSVTGEIITALELSDEEVYVTYEVDNKPFQFSDSYEEAHWYNIRFNNMPSGVSETQWIGHFYDTSWNQFEGQLWWNNGGNTDWKITLDVPRAYYAFIGDPYNFSVVNMYAGCHRSVYLDSDSKLRAIVNDENSVWTLEKPYSQEGDNLFRITLASSWETSHQRWYPEGYSSSLSNTRIILSGAENTNNNMLAQAVTKDYQLVAYNLYDKDGNFVVRQADYYDTGVNLSVNLPEKLRRGYCIYTYYSDSEMETGVTEGTAFTTDNDHTYYVKYTLNEKGTKIFSTTVEGATPLHIKAPSYGQSSPNYFVVSDANGVMSFPGSFDSDKASNYEWKYIGTPYGFRILNISSGKYLKTPSRTKNAVLSATGTLEEDIYWEADLPFNATLHEATLMLKDTWKEFVIPWYVYPNNHFLVSENKSNHLDIVTETSTAYTYHIVDNSNRIAISYTLTPGEAQFPGISLDDTAGHAAIPSRLMPGN